jgi:hypothetical protein
MVVLPRNEVRRTMTAPPLLELQHSFPPLTPSAVPADEWAFLQELPEDYLAFLLAQNGGFAESFRYTFQTGVPFKTDDVDTPSRDDAPIEFFGVPTVKSRARYPRDLLQVAVDYAAEEFLPSNLIAIASCVQSSLVCIAVDGPDRGAIYYWDWYWQYPWCKQFFDQRISAVREKIPDYAAVVADTSHARYREVADALNFATVTRLADSMSQWILSCQDVRTDDDEEARS